MNDHSAPPVEIPITGPQDIFRLVTPELEKIELELVRQSASSISLVNHINRYLHSSGGKRIRPVLLLLCAKMCGGNGDDAVRLASVMELIHTATLVHDDIIDGAHVRRGHSSVNAKWGNEITVLIGDWLYMTAFCVALQERSFRILDLLIDITRKMVEGELLQLERNGRLDITERDHLEMVERKTARLFAGCAQLGGIMAHASSDEEEALGRYGFNVGMAFQLVDDMLDFTSSEAVLGKPVINDLKEGKLTLPLIYLLEQGDPRHAHKLGSLLKTSTVCDGDREQIVSWVHDFGTLERTLSKAIGYAESAKRCLQGFRDSVYRQALIQVPDFIVSRDR
ncbi:MAG: polyprenyl synthetase family protein [Acidobacteria bacterium]|nr:polyprenyl synthetase family protein [Acidobacteriota bacterium]